MKSFVFWYQKQIKQTNTVLLLCFFGPARAVPNLGATATPPASGTRGWFALSPTTRRARTVTPEKTDPRARVLLSVFFEHL